MSIYSERYKTKMRLGIRLENLLKLVLRLELCLLQAKGLCSGSDIIFPSTLLRLGLGNKSEARPSVHNVLQCLYVPPDTFLLSEHSHLN